MATCGLEFYHYEIEEFTAITFKMIGSICFRWKPYKMIKVNMLNNKLNPTRDN